MNSTNKINTNKDILVKLNPVLRVDSEPSPLAQSDKPSLKNKDRLPDNISISEQAKTRLRENNGIPFETPPHIPSVQDFLQKFTHVAFSLSYENSDNTNAKSLIRQKTEESPILLEQKTEKEQPKSPEAPGLEKNKPAPEQQPSPEPEAESVAPELEAESATPEQKPARTSTRHDLSV